MRRDHSHVQADLFSSTGAAAPDVWRITIDGVDYSFSLKRSGRAKNVILKVADDGGLAVVVPKRMKLDRLDDIIRGKSAWVRRHVPPLGEKPPEPVLGDGATLTYLGRRYVLRVTGQGAGDTDVSLSHGEVRVTADNRPDALREALAAWYRRMAAEHIRGRVAVLGKGLDYGSVRIKDMSTRWGSCSPKGNLSFSWRLVAAPGPVIDYIVVHELMHLMRPDHSKGFWRLVKNRCPDYERLRKWLSENGRGLGRPL